MKRLLPTLMLLLCALLGQSQNLIIEEKIHGDVIVCDSVDISYYFTNSFNEDLKDISIHLRFPPGISYVNNSVQGAMEISGGKNPTFVKPVIRSGDIDSITLRIGADCEARAKEGQKFVNTLTLEYDLEKQIFESTPPYTIRTPFLIIADVHPVDTTITAMHVAHRFVTIENTRLGRLKRWVFVDRHPNGLVTTNQGRILEQSPKLLRVLLDSNDFKKVGNKDRYFDYNERLTVEEFISLDSCDTGIVRSDLQAQWGCEEAICQEDLFTDATVEVKQLIEKADLELSMDARHPSCPCNPEEQKLKICNNGLSTATGITLKLGHTKKKGSGAILPNPIWLNQGQDSIPLKIIERGKVRCSDINEYYILSLPPIEMGECVEVHFDYSSCSQRDGQRIHDQYDLAIKSKVVYSSLCASGSKDSSVISVRKAGDIRFNVIGFERSEIIKDGDRVTLKFRIISPNLTRYKHGQLWILYNVPCGFKAHPEKFVLGGRRPKYIMVSTDTAMRFTHISAGFKLPFRRDTVLGYLELELDCDTPCLQRGNLAEFLLINSSCPLGPAFSKLKAESEHCINFGISNCPLEKEEDFCIYSQDGISVKTPIMCHSGDTIIQSAPGYVDFEGSLERLNRGLADVDNNRLPDTPLVSADKSMIYHNRCIEYDTMRLHINGQFISDTPGVAYNRLYVSSGFNTSYFHFLRSHITIKDKSTGKIYQCYSDSLGGIPGRGELNPCNTVVKPASTSTGVSVIFHTDYLKSLDCGIPQDFYYEDGDSIYVTMDYVMSTQLIYTHGTPLPFKSGVFIFSEDYKHSPFSCGSYENVITIGKLSYTIESLGSAPDIEHCAPPNARNYYHLSMNPGMANFFPNEFRKIMAPEDVYYTIDPAITLDSVVLHYFYPDTSSPTQPITHKSTIVPQLENSNSHRWIFPEKQDFALDESYDVLIYPYISLKDCHDLVTGFTDSVQEIKIFTNHFPPSIYFYDINDAVLVRHRWDHRYGFQRERDYELFKFEIPAIQIRSTTDKGKWIGRIKKLDPSLREVRFKILSLSSHLNNVRIKDNKGRVYLENDGVIIIKPLSDSIKTLTIIADDESCDWQYMTLISAWGCDTTGDFFDRACSIDTFHLSVKTYPPELEMNIFSTPGPFDICDTMRYVELSIWNANRGAAFDVMLDMNLPLGFELLEDELVYAFDRSNDFKPMPAPKEISPGHYQWELNELIDAYKEDGWPGVEHEYAIINIRLSGVLDCNFQPDAYLHFQVKGRNNCYIPTNIVRRNSDPLHIRNTDPSVKTLSFNGSFISPDSFACQSTALLTVKFFASKPFSPGDKIQVILPAGLDYIPGSIVGISHFVAKEPDIIYINGRTILEWQATEVVDGFVDISFSLEVRSNPDLLACNEYEIQVQGTHNSKAICKTTGEQCELDVIEGSETLKFVMDKGHIRFFSMDSLYFVGDSSLHLCFRIAGNWVGMDERIDSFKFELSGDQTGDGKTADDPLISAFNVYDTLRRGDTLSVCVDLTGQVSKDICHFILEMVNGGNCICAPAISELSRMPEALYFKDTLCPGASTTIGVSGISGASYRWEGPALSCTDCSQNEIKHSFQNDSIFSRTYHLTEASPHACMQDYYYTIYFLPVFVPELVDFEICFGDSIELSVPLVDAVQWKGADPRAPLSGNPVIAHPQRSGTWTVSYIDTNGCVGNGSFVVTVDEADKKLFSISPDTSIYPGGTAHLWVKGPGNFEWEPTESLSCSQCDHPDATPDSTTTYTVTIMDDNGCLLELNVTVTVLPPPCEPGIVFVPNAFSPNGDGVNDLLYVRGNFIDEIEFVIYDRWGEKVFETFDIKVPWDGNYKGVSLPPDVYSYYLKVKCSGGEDFIKTGNTTILK